MTTQKTENHNPAYVVRAIVERQNNKPEFINIGALWANRNTEGYNGRINSLPVSPNWDGRFIIVPFKSDDDFQEQPQG